LKSTVEADNDGSRSYGKSIFVLLPPWKEQAFLDIVFKGRLRDFDRLPLLQVKPIALQGAASAGDGPSHRHLAAPAHIATLLQ